MANYIGPKVIIWLDPGGTTGVAWWTVAGQTGSFEVPHCDTDIALVELCREINGVSRYAEPFKGVDTHLGIERFDFRKDETYRDKIDYIAAEVIGAVRLWAAERPNILLIKQGAGDVKKFWTDERIKTLGLWVPGNKHAMDAVRHLLAYRAFKLHQKELFKPFRPRDVSLEGL